MATHLEKMLWFAWKIVLLQYRKQLLVLIFLELVSCDLLEKSYFCSIANNILMLKMAEYLVVICLKNRTFAVSQTTCQVLLVCENQLWFAWKIVLLQYRKQLLLKYVYISSGCDLLEKSYFCSIANNQAESITINGGLWFAWKIVLLQYRKQPSRCVASRWACCDLLEKSYFCSIANNKNSKIWTSKFVVICLKNRTFAVSQTTRNVGLWRRVGLWFAWKIVLLQYRKQLAGIAHGKPSCCDLLEKSYFCSIANNGVELTTR